MLGAEAGVSAKPALRRLLPFLKAAASIAAVILFTDFVHFFVYRRSYIGEYVLAANLPLKLAGIQVWALGHFPLWHSGLAAGWPIIADASTLPFDWRNIFYFLLNPIPAYWLSLFASRLLGALILFYYFRIQHRLSFWAALPATFVYFCGTLIIEDSRIAGAAVWDLLPGYLWLTERLFQRLSAGRVAALSAYCLLMYTMGSVAFAPYLGPVAGLWAFALFVADPQRDWRRFALFTLVFLAANALGLALIGVSLVPFIEFLFLSNRGGEYGNDPFALRSLFFALFGPHDQYNAFFPPFNFMFYVGVLSIPLLVMTWGNPTNAYQRALPWLSLVTLGTMVILTTPVKGMLIEIIPGLATFGALRMTPFWGFLAALGVGIALDKSEWRPNKASRVLTWIMLSLQVGVLLFAPVIAIAWLIASVESPTNLPALSRLTAFVAPGFLVLAGIRALGLFAATTAGGAMKVRALGVLLLAEVTLSMAIARPSTEVKTFYPESPEVTLLKSNHSLQHRVLMTAPHAMHGDWDAHTTLLFNAALVHGLSTAGIYHSLIIKEYADLFEDFGDIEERKAIDLRGYNQLMWTHRAASPLLDALAVRYLISALPARDPVNDVTRLIERVKGANYIIYERPDAMPRAFFVSAGHLLDRGEIHKRLQSIARGQFTQQQLRRYVMLDQGTISPGDIPPDLMSNSRPEAFVPARIERDTHNTISLTVNAPTGGWLVLSDAYYPGWRARVDGKTVPIVRANGFARAIPLTAGEHKVEFRFRPRIVRYGAALSAAGAIVLAVLVLVATGRIRWPRRATREQTSSATQV